MKLPAIGARIGMRYTNDSMSRWLPFLVHAVVQDIPGGTIQLRKPGASPQVLFGVRIRDAWEWLPASQCKFKRACGGCYGTGWHHLEKGKPTMVGCKKCKSKGLVPDRSPFKQEDA